MTLIYVCLKDGQAMIRPFSQIEILFSKRKGSRYIIVSEGFATFTQAQCELVNYQKIIQSMCS